MGGEGEHILSRFDDELEAFRALALKAGRLALEQVRQAVLALGGADLDAAQRVLTRERRIDQLDMEAQERVIELLAIHRPVARDLRFILAVSRTITDLERVADEAEKIARVVLDGHGSEHRFSDLTLFDGATDQATLVAGMLQRALDALRESDVGSAVAVIQEADRLDRYFDAAMRQLATYILQDARNIKQALDAVVVLKALERVGDHAANIAGNLILQVTGKDVRYIKAEHLSEGYLDPV